MLHHPTLDKLQQLRLVGMSTALREQLDLPDIHTYRPPDLVPRRYANPRVVRSA